MAAAVGKNNNKYSYELKSTLPPGRHVAAEPQKTRDWVSFSYLNRNVAFEARFKSQAGISKHHLNSDSWAGGWGLGRVIF